MIVKRSTVSPIDFDGLQIHDYTAGRNTSSSLAVVVVPSGARHSEAYSQHSDKYYNVISGQILMTLDGNDWELVSGDLCLVPRDQRFRYKNPTLEPAALLLVHTPGFELEAEVFVDQN